MSELTDAQSISTCIEAFKKHMRYDFSSNPEMIAIPWMLRHSSNCVSLLSLEDKETEDEASMVLKQDTDQSDKRVS